MARSEVEIRRYTTAIHRKRESKPMRDLWDGGYVRKGMRVLDDGCGYGADVRFLRGKGCKVEGIDPHDACGFTHCPAGLFDMVTSIYVLNTLPLGERWRVIEHGWNRLKRGGVLFLAVRTNKEIEALAKKHGWRKHEDGYITSRGTFQRGFNTVQLMHLTKQMLDGFMTEAHFVEKKKYVGLLVAKKRWT